MSSLKTAHVPEKLQPGSIGGHRVAGGDAQENLLQDRHFA